MSCFCPHGDIPHRLPLLTVFHQWFLNFSKTYINYGPQCLQIAYIFAHINVCIYRDTSFLFLYLQTWIVLCIFYYNLPYRLDLLRPSLNGKVYIWLHVLKVSFFCRDVPNLFNELFLYGYSRCFCFLIMKMLHTSLYIYLSVYVSFSRYFVAYLFQLFCRLDSWK